MGGKFAGPKNERNQRKGVKKSVMGVQSLIRVTTSIRIKSTAKKLPAGSGKDIIHPQIKKVK
jgi:hypothetical protein